MTLEAQRSLRVGNRLPSPHVPQDLKSHLFVKSLLSTMSTMRSGTPSPAWPCLPVHPFPACTPDEATALCPSGSDRTERDPQSVDSSLAPCANAAAEGLAHLRTQLAHSSVTHSRGDGTGSRPAWAYYDKASVNALVHASGDLLAHCYPSEHSGGIPGWAHA